LTAEEQSGLKRYEADHVLLAEGWASPGWLEIGDDGTIVRTSATTLPGPVEHIEGYVVPGAPNVHSHAHHRGIVGWADRLSGGRAETLWSWRERMYEHVLGLSPENLEALAAQAYIEMLKRGFTSVGEFHYVHHDTDGRPYAQPEELSARIVAAARRAGIALTLLPALYTSGGIGRPPAPEQRRFTMGVEAYLRLVTALQRDAGGDGKVRIGVAPHSLRAVQADELQALLGEIGEGPIHIHVAERTEEVEEIRAGLGATPVDWLLANADVCGRWTLIHATHITSAERVGIARSGAVVGLCPLTEANLADGRFPLPDYRRDGGRWGIGSDANHLIDLPGELRMLEYGQRLAHHRRDTLLAEGESSVGAVLLSSVLAGGAQALAQPVGALRAGLRADLVVLDPRDPALAGQAPDTILDAWIFSTASVTVVRSVMVAGQWVIVDGHHPYEEEVLTSFRETMRQRHPSR
jgi:formimidoylglutamate deiminase